MINANTSPVQQVVFADNTVWTPAMLMAMALAPTDGNDDIRGLAGNDSLTGGLGNDTFVLPGDDTLDSGAGNDQLIGGDGNDLLRGGAGTDGMGGGNGKNVFLFGRGDGPGSSDLVSTSLPTPAPASTPCSSTRESRPPTSPSGWPPTLQSAACARSEVNVAGGDKITFNNFLYFSGDPLNPYNQLQQLRFADGTVWDMATLQAMLTTNTVTGTGAAETLTGTTAGDKLLGLGGNDNLSGGGAGSDWLDGGSGDDTRAGGAGNDFYIVDSVADVVTELAGEGYDTVRSSVTTTLGSNVEALVLTGTAALNGTGNALANRLYGNAASNVLDGGAGNDTMVGGVGDDTYVVA